MQQALRLHKLVRLYTDQNPPGFKSATTPEENRKLQNETFATAQLPLYVILKPRPDGGFDEVARYDEGKINDVAGFIRFLKQPLEKKDEMAVGGSG